MPESRSPDVLRLRDGARAELEYLLDCLGLHLVDVADGDAITGSYWGDSEAGLESNRLLARNDTPLHSILHEAAHFACMDEQRREKVHTDAGGDDVEECAVCYLQVLWSDRIPGLGRARMLADMDAWGYSFRLGSARAWFERDAEDALEALQRWDLVTAAGTPTMRLRSGA